MTRRSAIPLLLAPLLQVSIPRNRAWNKLAELWLVADPKMHDVEKFVLKYYNVQSAPLDVPTLRALDEIEANTLEILAAVRELRKKIIE